MDVIREIMPGDQMYEAQPEHYFKVGDVAVRLIREALSAAELGEPRRILDFACGAGRVMRTLKAAFPEARLFGCDTSDEGLAFCARIFGARTRRSYRDLSKVNLPGRFDVIWCGSLLTHVDEDNWRSALRLWRGVLRGVLVFTTFGPTLAERERTERVLRQMTPEEHAQIIEAYDETGFGFVPSFSREFNFGDCITSREWTEARVREADLRILFYREVAWLSQDVIACVPA